MEDDDEFGDLYTDIVLPTAEPSKPPAAETIPHAAPAPNPNSAPAPSSTAADEEDDDDWLLGGSDPVAGVNPTADWVDEDDDGGAAPPAKREVDAKPPPAAEEPDLLMGVGADDPGAAIPGLSSSAAAAAAGSEDWDSDSEDDIQIVLNETDGRRRLGDDEGDDEDGLDLIIADGPHIPGMEEQEWVEDGAAAGPDGERKEGGETGKTMPMPGGRIGYSGGGQGFHSQHHSMFKYVRPGATPVGGALTAPAQFRPPGPPGPFSGRGRGDWRPGGGRGMNKGFHSGYGMTPWGGSGRGFGGGLDFTLPLHKAIYDIDIDTAFEEKPWKYPAADISDFFNFGIDEEKWKDYCKQIDQQRLESTMQSRIRVYESGRSEQDYDPDLPPELAAATGHHDTSADNRNKVDNGHTDFSAQGRAATSIRPAAVTGRPIQVETSFVERFPSADTRLPRMRESDSVIEIVCEAPSDDPVVADNSVDQSEKDSEGGNKKSNGVEESGVYTSEKMNNSPYNSTLGKKAEHTRRLLVSSEGDMPAPDVHGRSPSNNKIRGSPARGVRLKGRSLGVNPSREMKSSNEVPRQTTSSKRRRDTQIEHNPVDDLEAKDGSEGSPTVADEATDKLSTEDQFADNDMVALVDSAEVDGDDAISEPHSDAINEGDNVDHSSKKQKLISRAEQPPGLNSSDQDELKTLNSENSRGGRSGSSKDHLKRLESGEEVLQDRRSRRVNDVRRPHDGEERDSRRKDVYTRDVKPDVERTHLASRGREDIHHPHVNRDQDMRGKSYDRLRETEILQRREDNMQNRRGKEEDLRLDYNAEVGARHRNKARPIDRNDRDEDPHSRKWLDVGDLRGSRQKERGDMVLNRRDIDDSHIKRKKDEENIRRMKPENEDTVHGRGRDDPNKRKRERDDGIDQKRRDDSVRMREKADDRAKNKEDNWRQKEKEDRQRPKHESALILQREEGRGAGRSGRVIDDKLISGGRKKDESRSALVSKETQERGKQNEPGRRGQGAEENRTQNKGRSGIRPRDDNPNSSERNSRQEKLNKTHDNNRLSSSSDARQASKDKHRESTRKGRGSEPNEQDLHRSSKRRREDHESHRSGKVEMKGVREQENGRDHATSSKTSKNPQRHDSLVKQGEEEAMSDDENTEDSRRGRSKLERWTSHKEIDYSNIANEATDIFPSIKADVQPSTADASGKSDVPAIVGNSDLKSSGDNGQASEKTAEERERHLDTVERLKRRSERFKLPMPGEKEAPQNKKVDTEVQTPQSESPAADTEVKPERPARKRRWTGS